MKPPLTPMGSSSADPAETAPRVPNDIVEFLDAYREAFDTLDGDRIAALYAVPSGIAQGGVFTVWGNAEPIRQNMHALCALYRQRGYREAHYEPVSFVAQGSAYAIVDVRWRIEGPPGSDPWVFGTTYNLVKTPDGWKVLVCTAYAEDKVFGTTPGGA